MSKEMKKIVNKGYTLEAFSWENDGDHENTRKVTYETFDEALRVGIIARALFSIDSPDSISNDGDLQDWKILKYFEDNAQYKPKEDISDEELLEFVNGIAYSLLGNSEYYSYRVLETIELIYSEHDIYSETIKF